MTTAIELMEEILADADAERRNRRIRAWFAADREAGEQSSGGLPHPVICAAMDGMPGDLFHRWSVAVCEALGGPPDDDPEPAESPGQGQAASAKPAGASGGRG